MSRGEAGEWAVTPEAKSPGERPLHSFPGGDMEREL